MEDNRKFKFIKNFVSHPLITIGHGFSVLGNKIKNSINSKSRNVRDVKELDLSSYGINEEEIEDEEIELEEETPDFEEISFNNDLQEEEEIDLVTTEEIVSFFVDKLDASDDEKDILYDTIITSIDKKPELEEEVREYLMNENSKSYDELMKWANSLHNDNVVKNEEKVQSEPVTPFVIPVDKMKDNVRNFDDLAKEINSNKVETKNEDLSNISKNVVEESKEVKSEINDKKENKSKKSSELIIPSDEEIKQNLFENFNSKENSKKIKETKEEILKIKNKILNKTIDLKCASGEEKEEIEKKIKKLNKKLKKKEIKLDAYNLKQAIYSEECEKFYDSIMAEEAAKEAKETAKEAEEKEIEKAKEDADYQIFWYRTDESELSNLQSYTDEEIDEYINMSGIAADLLKSYAINNPHAKLK